MTTTHRFPHRRGAILTIVVGISVALLALALTFLSQMRADANISRALVDQAQARIMLTAACTYIQEASRVGHGEEAFGWRDIRDGSQRDAVPGPRGFDGEPLYAAGSGEWPDVGGVARCAMRRPVLPPWATKRPYAYNPVPRRWPHSNPNLSGGEIRYNNFEPQPAQFPYDEPDGAWTYDSHFTDDEDDGLVDGLQGHEGAWQAFAQGSRLDPDDPASLRAHQGGPEAWFRVYREDVDHFIVTVGTGATRGFRDWAEVQAAGAESLFLSDESVFQEAAVAERRQWYRVAWSPSVSGRSMPYVQQNRMNIGDHYGWEVKPPPLPFELMIPNFHPDEHNEGIAISGNGVKDTAPTYETSHMGSISFIERLHEEPSSW